MRPIAFLHIDAEAHFLKGTMMVSIVIVREDGSQAIHSEADDLAIAFATALALAIELAETAHAAPQPTLIEVRSSAKLDIAIAIDALR